MVLNPFTLYGAVVLVLIGAVVYLWMDRARLKQSLKVKPPETKPAEIAVSAPVTKAVSDEELKYLREQLSSFNQAMAQCPSSIIICDIDGNIQYVNRQFTLSSGYKMEDVVGRNPRFLKSGNMDLEVYENLWKTISQIETNKGRFFGSTPRFRQ
jgi:PAS domain-containing protein